MVDFGLADPGQDVLAPEVKGEIRIQIRGHQRGGFADGIQRAQFGGEIGQQQGQLIAIADGQRGAEILGVDGGFGVGVLAGQSPAREEGGNQAAIPRIRIDGLAGRRDGQQDFRQRRRGPAAIVVRPGGPWIAREFRADGKGAQEIALAFAHPRGEGFGGRRLHQPKTTVRFL